MGGWVGRHDNKRAKVWDSDEMRKRAKLLTRLECVAL